MKRGVPFSMISLGCARTLVDSEHVVNDLRQVGFELVAEGSGERVVVLNTCSFIQSAIDETEANIRGLIERKQRGEIQYVAVIGCYPSRLKPEERSQQFPEVDIWLTTQEASALKPSLARLVFKSRFQPSVPVRYTKLTPSHYAYLKISEGCDHWCSFCTIPKIRGPHRSFSIETVKAEAMKQVAFGVRELIVVAEDTTAWGEDLYGTPSLPRLLDALADIPGLDWIRLMYIFPNRVDTELIRTMNRHGCIIPYLDMPIQHCDTRLLGLMNRKYTGDTLRRVLDQLLDQVPGLVLRTSLIAGFPTETDEDFQSLQTFITQYPFAHLGCFAYSEEKETRSAKLTPKLPASVIADRIDALMATQWEQVTKRNQSLIGTTLEMVMEEGVGRSYREAPDVDGCLKPLDATGLAMGDVVPVTVIGVDGVDLLVEVNQ
ncbi:30S ribosomal protein S12 methylthiotransferase RimO [bacterium]|nr:30S ribosomal protein S12 methylthiotransferase RimO [bacterium]